MCAIALLFQALNFWTSTPTFNPIPKNIVGVAFLLIGVWQLVFLLAHNLDRHRIGVTASWLAIAFWGILNMQQSLKGLASFQLPIWLYLIACIEAVWQGEPPVNPMAELLKEERA